MAQAGYTLFDTALGRCGVAWGTGGLVAVQLPEASDAATRARLIRQLPGVRSQSPTASVRRAVAGIVELIAGEAVDLSDVALELERVSPFHRDVYAVARAIPVGATLTYGEVAQRLGDPGAARAVGQALGHNPWPIVVPCHRVVAAAGRLGGFSARGGTDTKLRLLAIERAHADAGLTLF